MIDKERKTSKSIIHLIDNHDSFVLIKIASHTNNSTKQLIRQKRQEYQLFKKLLDKKAHCLAKMNFTDVYFLVRGKEIC